MKIIPRPKKQKNNSKLLHEQYPDILFWEIGDEFCWPGYWYYEFIGMKEDGRCLMQSHSDKSRTLITYVKCIYGYNKSLIERRSIESKKSRVLDFNKDDYFQYIQDFNKAYKEIKGDFV